MWVGKLKNVKIRNIKYGSILSDSPKTYFAKGSFDY